MIDAVRLARRVEELGGYERRGHHLAAAEIAEAVCSPIAEERLPIDQVSIRALYESLVPNGREVLRRWETNNPRTMIEEADGWIDSTAFSRLTSQLVFSRVRERMAAPDYVLSRMVETIQSRLRTERMPGAGGIVDPADRPIAEGLSYPNSTLEDEQVESLPTEKRGLIVSLTREAILYDRTNLLISRADTVTDAIMTRKEKRIADMMFGINSGAGFIYNGTTYNTYQTSTPWINDIASNELITWEDIDEAWQLFFNMRDLTTGELMSVMPKDILVMPAKWMTLQTIIGATQVQNIPFGGTSGTTRGTVTVSQNPLPSLTRNLSVHALDRIVASGVALANAGKYWLMGDFREAFAYVENWGLTTTRATDNSEAEFMQDIVYRVKVSERGVPMVKNPQKVVRNRV